MIQDRNNTFTIALRAVLVATLMSLGVNIMAQVTVKGSVFGGGNEADVLTNTVVNISAGTVEKNVYGGGNLGDVGTIDKTDQTSYNYIWTSNADDDPDNDTGICTVEISGGTIGAENKSTANHASGHVFGAGKGSGDNTYWCEKGMVYKTSVTINKGTVYGNVYGGGEVGRVENDTEVLIDGVSGTAPEIMGSVFGAGAGLETHGYSALVRNNSNVTVQGYANIRQNVYGGGEIATVGRYWVNTTPPMEGAPPVPAGVRPGMPYKQRSGGLCTVIVKGHVEIGPKNAAATENAGHVFGAGKGATPAYNATTSKKMTQDGSLEGFTAETGKTAEDVYKEFLETLALVTHTSVTIGDATDANGDVKVKGSVYGGSENGFVQHNTSVSIQKGCKIGETDSYGNIYGGGKGYAGFAAAGRVSENATVAINDGFMYGSVYGGGELGIIKGGVNVNMTGGTVTKDVYGGGALADTNTENWDGTQLVSPYHEETGLTVGTSVVTGLYTRSGSAEPYTYTEITTANTKAASGTTYYRLTDTKVKLTGGIINGDAYGGGLGEGSGDTGTPAIVYGDVLVDLNGETIVTTGTDGKKVYTGVPIDATTAASTTGCIVNRVFGCNNVNGSPKGEVAVYVHATQSADASKTTIDANLRTERVAAENPSGYDVEAVYGGGNLAEYAPVKAGKYTSESSYPETEANHIHTNVIIDGCEYTSIKQVFGGGNAATTPATNVTIYGAYEINEVFGGGNGESSAAHVGFHYYTDATDKENQKYGWGKAQVNIGGGMIHSVFGGSNQNGNVREIAVATLDDQSDCTFTVDEAYGGGKEAEMDGRAVLNFGCIPLGGSVGDVYGGAKATNVNNDVLLNITNGTFNRVYGGNNVSGKVRGTITINVEEKGCTQIIINQLFGGGNLAAYSVNDIPEAKRVTDVDAENYYLNFPKVNVISATRIGQVYGGGDNADVTGNPHVKIDMIPGVLNQGTSNEQTQSLGVIGQVFGGGNNANVNGNTYIDIVKGQITYTEVVKTAATSTTATEYYLPGVYGGCNTQGTVSGDTHVNVTGGTIGVGELDLSATPKDYSRETKGNVFGGGYGKDTYVAGNVEVNIGTSSAGNAVIFGDVYGGGALGHVNAEKPTGSTPIPYTSGKTTTVNLNNGTIFGDAYGGGLGQKTGFNGATVNHAAFVGGDVVVNVNGAAFIIDYENTNDKDPKDNTKWIQALTSGRVFGCNNLNGYPLGDVTVTVNKTVKGNVERSSTASKTNDNATYEIAAVYGGGNLADYTPTKTGAKPYVIINDCDVSIKQVYGGGNAAEVPGTDVDVRGAYEIHQVFGGGNGADKYKDDNDWQPNPGANVNGSPNTLLKGGVIHEAYGGSNEKGITGTISIKMVDGGLASCPLDLGKMVVAGKNADTFGDVKAVMDCNPSSKTPLIYFGADNANVWGNVEMTITSGNFGKVFAGNNLGGAIFGHVILNIEETGNCPTPITIDELYLGGNQASYSIYGYYREQTGTDGDNNPIYVYKPRTSATDAREPYYLIDKDTKTVGVYSNIADFPGYAEPVLNVISATRIDEVFGGGYGEGGDMYANPTVNINMVPGSHAATAITRTALNGVADNHRLGTIGNVYGGGNAAVVYGNTTVNIGTESKVYMVTEPVHLRANSSTPMTPVASGVNKDLYEVSTEGAYITGNVYGGGKLADVTGNTFVNICAKKSGDDYVSVGISDDNYEGVTIGENGVNDANHGNVFGGGKGLADNFLCDKAMVGEDGKGVDSDFNDDLNYLNGNTSVIIGNGTINGNVYGGGEIGRVEKNTNVTIGLGNGDANKTSAPIIRGDVFGGGKGDKEHGYAALVRGNPTVIVQGDAKVGHSVYGAGEIASVARYRVPKDENEVNAAIAAGYKDAKLGMPYALANTTTHRSGYCTVKVQGNAEIGPDGMQMTKAGGPDDAGHVFAAGKGFLPEGNWGYNENDKTTMPRRMVLYDAAKFTDANQKFWEYVDPTDANNKNVWEYFPSRAKYIEFIQTQALASNTEVTIGDDNGATPFIKGSVYGGSENGLVQFDTKVYIKGGQIGVGKNTTERHPDAVWADNYDPSTGPDLECASWEYKAPYAPYDPYAKHKNATDGKYYYDDTYTKSAEGGAIIATDGHTYYGNVFGGGSGSVPYFDTTEGNSKYLNTAGTVKGNTTVEISGGHILTNVYGGCEATNVLGKATVEMTGGTIGVPRTLQQIINHPVTCYLFGGGKGDQRIFFNKDTNVEDVEVQISGGRIYGSVFGGGEDGHVMRDVKVTIGQEGGNGPKIGTLGSTYVDGNVFGGGRGFGGEALTAGNVGGTIDLIINGGEMLGSVYGGGRLASVGYGLYLVDEVVGGVKPYGVMRPDNVDDKGNTVDNFKRGYITVTINGGTIGKEFTDDAEGEHSGNVFGGSMGRLTKLDGSSFDDPKHWTLLATAKSTTVNINGGIIKRSVYGGGEMGTVTTDAIVNVSGGTIGTSGKGGAEFGNVYGGGKGYVDPAGSNYVTAGIIKGNTTVAVSGTPQILHNVYGGGAYGSVGTFTYDENNVITGYTSGGKAEIYVTGGTIGTDGKENGMIFGSSRGDVGAPNSIHDKLAWVYDTHVAIGDTTSTTITTATPLIKGSVYGGGENGHNYRNAYVRINGGTIGIASDAPITDNNGTPDDTTDDITYSGAEYPYRGNVYGGGCGTDKYYSTSTESHDGNGDTYNSKAGIVQGNAIVHVTAGHIVRNVYGAGAMGSVGTMTKDNDNLVISSGGKTTIEISGGTVGVSGSVGDGNVFGAARGDETTKQTDVALVKTTDVTVSGNSTVWGNVYGGGQIGCVGTFTERADDGKYIWTSDDQNLNGLTKVSITGGETKGHVFGAGKGSAVTFKCEKAMVKKTQVSVSNGKVDKNVYGGGEIGRVEEDTDVKIGVGDGTCTPIISGSVYGAGAGLETHGYSALVRHNTTVTVDGGATIGQSVYGGGEIASVGRYGLDDHKMPEILLDGGYCYVTVQGSATIGSTTVQGNVFGACKGVVPHFDKTNADRSKRSRRMTVYNASDFPDGAKIDATTGNASSMTSTNTTWEYYDESVTPKLVWEYFQEEDGYNKYLETLALATHPEVTIDGGATVNGSVYGGGEMGLTKGSVMVNILGGTITEDVYGGGALANTNTTSAVGVLNNAGIPQKESDGKFQTTTVYPKTTVNLLGGSMRDAYGGGLGQLALAAQGTEGQAGYQAAVSAIEAKVFGNVKVNLNGLQAATDINTTLLSSLTTGGKLVADGSRYNVNSSVKGAVVNRVFGCNNLNGTPTKKVQVYVFGTQHENETQIANAGAVSTAKVKGRYDVQAVYGGGNLSPYKPDDALLSYTDENKSKVDAARPEVYIDGCDRTSIKQVYGGGNAAPVPASYVEINRAYEIDEAFGGGNGYDNYSLKEGNAIVWYQNPGANVGYYTYASYPKGTGQGSGLETDPYIAVETPEFAGGEIHKEARLADNAEAAAIRYGSGIATLVVKGGTIHTSYGGSNSKGNVRAKLLSTYTASFDDCPMAVGQSYGGGKNAYSDADADMSADCAKGVKEMFGGSKDADFNGNINMLITNGSSLQRVFGGNNTSGAVNGSITITLKEGGCEPIRIDELYLGGFLAPYSVYGYAKNEDGSYKTELVDYLDENNVKQQKLQRIPLKKGEAGALATPHKDPRINVISATYIGNIFGGGYQAKLVGNPHINVNMEPGRILRSYVEDPETFVGEHKDANNNVVYVGKGFADNGDGILEIGTIGNIYGGGNMADIVGDTYVEIGTGTMHNDNGELVTITPARNAATITGNVFGGGNRADITGDTYINFGGGSVNQSIYGGGSEADVLGNTHVTMTDGYVFNGIFGGGLAGSVGTFTRDKNVTDFGHTANHDGCIGKPIACKEGTGTCYVVVSGGQIGPVEVATEGMTRLDAAGGPVPQGWVWGAGCGIVEDPAKSPDTHFKAYVNNTDVTIKDKAFILESIIGGGEFGRVLGNTLVKIEGGQIGVGDKQTEMVNGVLKPKRYTDDQFIDPTSTTTTITEANALATCSHFPFGKVVDGKKVYECYDPYADAYKAAKGSYLYPGGVTDGASDGKTWIGCVFAGGSGYMPYVNRDGSGKITDYDWVRSAGWVEGNTEVRISGGHILTNVYGGNEYTDVKGTSKVIMTGGTIGVPRTKEQIEALPMSGYIYGAGKGDERTHFNTATNVGHAEVEVSGGIVYGSVYGGGEDGHVLGDAKVTIKDGAKIGSSGTSYFDGNVFGGGRGFSGIAQTAGTVGGNVTLNIEGGTMYGSVYGGGRLASVGTMFEYTTLPNGDPNPAYGIFKEDDANGSYGHVTINISGGTIGNEKINASDAGAQYSGNVFGGSMGRLDLLDGTRNPIWPKMAQVKTSTVNIYGNADIRRSVYGGGELGTVRDNAYVTIGGTLGDDKVTVTKNGSPTVRRDVYGGGYGSEDRNYTVFTVNELEGSSYVPHTYAFTPMQFAGCVGQNTFVNIAGGYIRKSVYGGGEMASVGVINYRAKEVDAVSSSDVVVKEATANSKAVVYSNMVKHADETKEFALSWPYKLEYVGGYPGATHVKVTGGRLGLKNGDVDASYTDNGDVFGAGKGKAGDYKDYLFCANVGSTDVYIKYDDTAAVGSDDDCISGAAYGGGEDGHVMGDTKLTLVNGLVGHSVYGAGSGKGQFTTDLKKIGATSDTDTYPATIYSITAGKVFGNSTVEMSGGHVVRNIYGGGNMGSVGKGNYAGGTDDYSYYVAGDKTYNGYGEALNGSLWTASSNFNPKAPITETNKPITMADHFLGSGKCTVKITGGTVGYIANDPSSSMYPYNSSASLPYGNVFGGCRGESAPNITESPRYLYSPEFFVGYANETSVTIDGDTKILGSVYGGGMDGHIRRDTHVEILGGEIGLPYNGTNRALLKTDTETDLSKELNNIQWLARGNVYGAGSGIGKYKYDFDYNKKTSTDANGNGFIEDNEVEVSTYHGNSIKEEDYSTSAGSVTRFTNVEVKGGKIYRNVYGGGSLSTVGAPKIPPTRTDDDPYHPNDSEHSSDVGRQSLNKVTISGGQIGDDAGFTAGYGGDVNGGSRGDINLGNKFSTAVFTDVTINGTADVKGNVFGGGEAGMVKHDTEVKMQGGTVGNDLYGGGDLADVGGNTVVDMTGGTIKHDAFGGARGTADVAAEVKGNATVTLNGTKFIPAFDTSGILTGGRIFGANNVNGTPKGHVKVHVLKTVDSAKDPAVALANRTTYDVGAVYGGGNNADYRPTSTSEFAEVIIDGCDETSIKYVFGGGNAAATPANEVKINGCYIIDNVFGGGNGTVSPANVGYDEAAIGDTPAYKTLGTAKTNLSGGYIHNVYGGSNNEGSILGGASVTNDKYTGPGCCENLQVQEIYGGGKQADMFGGAEIVLGCMPNDWIGAIYAGAENADVGNDVSLTLTSGKFERVFGGNKSGGVISGSIEVNIEENPNCETPIIIGELYGGGNMAPYTVPEDYTKNNPNYLSPRVNVRAFTSIGNIYGGGLGANATVTGNPWVNINEVEGGRAYAGETRTLDGGTKVTLYDRKADGKMGVIGNVFGGGNAAPVIGNPRVEIGTAAKQKMLSLQTKDADGTIHEVEKDVLGADIRGNVYGGGNNATVTGDPKVVIGQKKTE